MRCVLVAGLVLGLVTAHSGVALRGQPAPSVWDRIYTDEQAGRGEAIYRATCEGCHAPDLSGGKVVPELVGQTFRDGWDGSTLGRLFERVVLSMPEGDPASVTREQKGDILAFILRANGFPSGERELEPRTELLDRFTFSSQRRTPDPSAGGFQEDN